MQDLPEAGFVFWPVGNGDSTTIVPAFDDLTVQVDLNHLEAADDSEDPRVPVLDHLVQILPKRSGRPYLGAFVLTHPDLDHCRGFAEMQERIDIGELWFSPRIFSEYKKDLCDDAVAFRAEAMRRVKKTIEERWVASGDRVRIIGYTDVLEDDAFRGFPEDRLTVPGNAVEEIDGNNCSRAFRAFIHAPFKDDADGDRNGTSIAMQVTLQNYGGYGCGMFLGDHAYPVLKRIFSISNDADLYWHVLLSPHHCSKSAMYWQEEGDKKPILKQDILEMMESVALDPGYIIASSEAIPSRDTAGANPPHKKAANRYKEIAPTAFGCTGEHGSQDAPQPIVFEVDSEGVTYRGIDAAKTRVDYRQVATAARGGNEPPSQRVGFGWKK